MSNLVQADAMNEADSLGIKSRVGIGLGPVSDDFPPPPPNWKSGSESSCSDEEDHTRKRRMTRHRHLQNAAESMGPVMTFLGENQSHPVHLVGQLQHQAKPGIETLFCSAALNYTREKRVRQTEPLKWGR